MTAAKKPDGGPAFPSKMTGYDQSVGLQDDPVRHEGMSLRDYFAASALTGLFLLNRKIESNGQLAQIAYEQADAMLTERAK